METWKEVEGFSQYEVNLSGIIRHKETKKIRVQTKEKSGYMKVGLGKPGKNQVGVRVHRIVCVAFIPNPNGFNVVNHKDGNKANNHYSNLEWCTNKHNTAHAISSGLFDVGKKPLIAMIGGKTFHFGSREEASKYFNIPGRRIGYAINQEQKCKGVLFRNL
jgi:hypothetical protein